MLAAKKYSPEQSLEWLYARMDELGLHSLEEVSQRVGINRGTLYRYFTQSQRPGIGAVQPLCIALRIGPLLLLQVLGVWL